MVEAGENGEGDWTGDVVQEANFPSCLANHKRPIETQLRLNLAWPATRKLRQFQIVAYDGLFVPDSFMPYSAS